MLFFLSSRTNKACSTLTKSTFEIQKMSGINFEGKSQGNQSEFYQKIKNIRKKKMETGMIQGL